MTMARTKTATGGESSSKKASGNSTQRRPAKAAKPRSAAARKVASPAGNPAMDVGGKSGSQVESPIRCGVIGLGRIGWSHHCQVMQQHPGFQLVGVCDREADRVQEAVEATGCAGHRQPARLLADDSIELVVVATPSTFHQRMSIQALEAGKHVLVEKPSALSAKGIDCMIRAAKKSARLLTMHHNYRLNPEFLTVREIIEKGTLGQVFRIKRTVAGFSRRNDWQVLRKYGGGMTGNWGVHLVDQGLQLLGAPVKTVWGSVHHLFNPGNAEDDIKAIIEGRNGVVIDVDMTSVDASTRPSWIVCGDRGTLWIQDGQMHLKYLSRKRVKQLEPMDLPYAVGRSYGVQPKPDKLPWKEEAREIKPKGTYGSFYDNLYEAVRDGKELLVTPESARLTYDVLDRIKQGSGF
jgi:scyllo-inositol 2-dehydrogenase (NADP+)